MHGISHMNYLWRCWYWIYHKFKVLRSPFFLSISILNLKTLFLRLEVVTIFRVCVVKIILNAVSFKYMSDKSCDYFVLLARRNVVWRQLDSNLQPLSSKTNTQPFGQIHTLWIHFETRTWLEKNIQSSASCR